MKNNFFSTFSLCQVDVTVFSSLKDQCAKNDFDDDRDIARCGVTRGSSTKLTISP